VISEKVMNVLYKVKDYLSEMVLIFVVLSFAYALFYVATIPKQCLNGYVYEKSINDYWTKTKTECLPVSKE
jgi:hypothetical protein